VGTQKEKPGRTRFGGGRKKRISKEEKQSNRAVTGVYGQISIIKRETKGKHFGLTGMRQSKKRKRSGEVRPGPAWRLGKRETLLSW